MNTTYSLPNILVVDDVNTNLALLTEMIHNAGYIARPVISARQAVSAIEAFIPNLILLDISMPDIDGFTFCSMLKSNAKTRGIPVILISAMSTPEDKIKGFKAGADDYIVKPFEAEELVLRIGIHLKTYKIQQELEIYNKKLNKIVNDQIEKIYEEQKNLISALAVLSVRKDSAGIANLERIGKNCRLLAMSLQMSLKYKNQITNSFIDAIELASQLYNIGEFAFCKSKNQKSVNTKADETKVMNNHSAIGAEILEEIYSRNKNNDLLKMAIDITRYYHENWDGTGYPKGLRETEIPLSARIVAVIDVYDSLVGESPGKKAYTHEKSIKLINEGSGLLFDPDIVTVFNKIHQQLIK